MIGNDQQVDRAAKLIIGISKEPRIDMTVRANQGQVFNARVELFRCAPLRRIGGEVTIPHRRFSRRLPNKRRYCTTPPAQYEKM